MKMKSKFDIVYEEIMDLLTEGGHAIEGAVRIKLENIKPTMDEIKKQIFDPLGIGEDLYTYELGSAGKKPDSGDLDIAVKFNEKAEQNGITEDEMKDRVFKLLDEKGFTPRKIAKRIHFGFPIQGTQSGEIVQVDLFPSYDLEYSKSRFYSPAPNESNYGGAERQVAFSSLVKTLTMAAADDAEEVGEFISPDNRKYPAVSYTHTSIKDDGVYNVRKSFWSKRKNVKYNKNSYEDKTRRLLVTRSYQELLDQLFGTGVYRKEDFDTFEKIWAVITSPTFKYKDRLDEIVLNLYESFKDPENMNSTCPKEILDYMAKNNLQPLS